jgi:hypothetical protein
MEGNYLTKIQAYQFLKMSEFGKHLESTFVDRCFRCDGVKYSMKSSKR